MRPLYPGASQKLSGAVGGEPYNRLERAWPGPSDERIWDEWRTEAGDVHGLREHRPRREGSAVQAVRAQAGPGAAPREGQDHRAARLRGLEPLHRVQAPVPRMGHRADRRPPVRSEEPTAEL